MPQQRDRAQDREPVAVEIVDQAEDLLALALQAGLVQLAVARVELNLERLLLLGGKVSGDELLGAALDQGLDPSPQAREALAVGLAFDRARVLLGEMLRVGKEPRCSDREQRPELGQVVLIGVPVRASLNGAGSSRTHL